MAKTLGPASVVDTNVAVVAEGRNDDVSPCCRAACEEEIEALVKEGVVVVDEGGFEELPPNRLDPSDRKFLATAVVGEARILNAVDSDWAEQRTLTDDLGVDVVQLCPKHATRAGA